MNLSGLKERLFQRYLVWLCRPSVIRRHLQRRLTSVPIKDPVDRRRIRVAALQVNVELCQSPLAFVDLVHRRIREAAAAGAWLVVFPEYLNLLLFGMLPGLEQFEQDYRTETAVVNHDSDQDPADQISLPDLFRFMTPVVLPLLTTLFSELAAAYQLYVMSGSYTIASPKSIVNRAFLYGPQGESLGSQDKVHLLPIEEEWKLKRGKNFKVFNTAIGRLAMPICMDATYFETFRVLEENGAEIVMLPIANLEAYNYWLALRGIWPRVQESPIFGVKSALVGSIAGLTFTGRAGIFAPLELTANHDGVLAEVDHFDREAMAVADLDLEALDELRCHHPWRDKNQVLYNHYFPQIYHR
jgi:predicted amidohydrolase